LGCSKPLHRQLGSESVDGAFERPNIHVHESMAQHSFRVNFGIPQLFAEFLCCTHLQRKASAGASLEQKPVFTDVRLSPTERKIGIDRTLLDMVRMHLLMQHVSVSVCGLLTTPASPEHALHVAPGTLLGLRPSLSSFLILRSFVVRCMHLKDLGVRQPVSIMSRGAACLDASTFL
jgi:hypothetical protein